MQTVFLVDDSPLVLERLEELIEEVPGTRVVGSAGDSRDAIREILAIKPDVVLLDLSLSQGSGFDVLAAVHAREPGIDIYMLSNLSSEPYRRQAARLGAQGFFDKSSEFERVRDVVAQRAANLQH